MAQVRLATAPQMTYSGFFARCGPVPYHPEVGHSRDCADEFQHRWALGHCCTPRVRGKMLGCQAEFVYLSSWSRFVRSRDQRQILSQISTTRRTTQRASHVPSGFPHASHSFFDESTGLLRCVEIVRSVMIAIIYSRTQNNTPRPHQSGISLGSQVSAYLGEVDHH
jgi:hypothetical protein